MGHADGGALVLRRYGHLYKGARRQAAIALESHVFADQKILMWGVCGVAPRRGEAPSDKIPAKELWAVLGSNQ